MPPGTHSVLLSAQVLSSVQEQQGHIAEGLWSGRKETGAGAFGNTIPHSLKAITHARSTHWTQLLPRYLISLGDWVWSTGPSQTQPGTDETLTADSRVQFLLAIHLWTAGTIIWPPPHAQGLILFVVEEEEDHSRALTEKWGRMEIPQQWPLHSHDEILGWPSQELRHVLWLEPSPLLSVVLDYCFNSAPSFIASSSEMSFPSRKTKALFAVKS